MKRMLLCIILSGLVLSVSADSFQLFNAWHMLKAVKKPEAIAFLFLTYYPSYGVNIDGINFDFDFVYPSPGTIGILQDKDLNPAHFLMQPSGRMLLLMPHSYPMLEFTEKDKALQVFYRSKLFNKCGAELLAAGREIEKLNYSSWSFTRSMAAAGGTGLLIWGGCEMLSRHFDENPDYLFPALLMGTGAALLVTVNISFIIDDHRITGLLHNVAAKANG